ncbi:hypothetical protein [Sulfurospirillum barnesii]|uniref:Uncharacterized protein n=1 Tax=Sulfurospirillum barnesii (strain ATCC 700032 / DSM 10660 / SES-3) TaxID=760154 RepID=I3XV74_SULBS|nr:hypothetical protein [Sulfurospirillum barnesii]AFL67848.1 hypothetical protein Sulba_0539 [Sulfurospirillum barnesii SES-3]
MPNLSAPIELNIVFATVGVICVVIGVCVYMINQRTKKLKDMK